jgi:hypothetical protein
MNAKTTITCRLTPCDCGCNGSDPWHRQTYERTLRNVETRSGLAYTRVHGWKRAVKFRAIAEAQLPFGGGIPTRIVEVVSDSGDVILGWYAVLTTTDAIRFN